MKNYKLENNLQEWKNWSEVSSIFIEGDPEAKVFELENTEENAAANEETIQSWKKVAVLKATSEKPVDFYLGFYDMNMSLYLKHSFTTDLTFGMRIGPNDLRYYAIPKNLDDSVSLELVKLTTEDDEKYKDLLLV